MDAEDRELFERSLAGVMTSASGNALDDALIELGWHEALASDPADAVALAFEQQGRARNTSAALGVVVLQALGFEPTSAPVVLPGPGSTDPPAQIDDGHVAVDGIVMAAVPRDATLIVPATVESASVVACVDAASLDLRPVDGIDPRLGIVAASGTAPATSTDAAAGWSAAVDAARIALGHELVGHSRRMLELAREHALDRVQFDRPIAGFQAIRHRLAEALLAIEAADAALDAAWLDGTSGSAAIAKALAGRGARTASRHCQQVLAGIGFTTEHDLHEHIRRVVVLDQLFGGAVALTRSLGEQVLATGELPALLPL